MTDYEIDIINLQTEIAEMSERVNLLERVFKKICEFDARLDTLEFNSNVPVKPAIAELLLDLRLRVETLETT